MKRVVRNSCLLLAVFVFCATVSAQTFASGGADKTGEKIEALTKKIDEQTVKIDTLSQQLLKLEQQLASIRPGVMIGETSPASAPSAAPVAANGNAHVVVKGETLTSIAKANHVGVQELQKFNHIENDRALQIGQTIMIPGTSPSPNE